MPELTSFDGVIGLDILNRVHASIDFKSNTISHDHGKEVIFFITGQDMNYLQLHAKSVPKHFEEAFYKIIGNVNGVFADPNEALPYNTNVIATIRTKTLSVPIRSLRFC